MPLKDYSIDYSNSIYFQDSFRRVIENHLEYLKNHPRTESRPLSPEEIHRFQGNFYGFLIDINIPAHLHWIIMRMNDMASPLEFTADKKYLVIPLTDTINSIRQRATSIKI